MVNFMFYAVEIKGNAVEAVVQSCFVKKVFLKISQNSQENTCAGKHLRQSLFFNKVAGFIKKETLAQVFPCEFYGIFKNTFFSQNISGGCFWRWYQMG